MEEKLLKKRIKGLYDKYYKIRREGRYNQILEEMTKIQFINPLFEALGWDIRDVKGEHEVTFGEKIGSGYVDYVFRINNIPQFILEAKPLKAMVSDERWIKQTIDYAFNAGITWAILCNYENIWVFNADGRHKDLIGNRFLKLNFDNLMRQGILAADICCGVGGLTRGLLDAGIQVKKGYDIDPRLKKTYEKNNEGVKFYHNDIRDLTGHEILKDLDLENNYLLLAACVPCQPFSQQNKHQKKTKDDRKFLLDEFTRLVEEIKPDFIFMENVPGLKTKGKRIFDRLLKILDKYEYNYDYDILDAKDYGVPQKRLRLILLASKHGPIILPEETHGSSGSGKYLYRTVRGAIARYPRLKAGRKSKKIPNHECRNLAPINRKRMKYIRKNGGLRTDLPEHLQLKCHKDHSGHSDVYGRMKWDDVSPTLTCKCTSITNGRFGHPKQTRGISVREAAALQTFRDDYVFYHCLSVTTEWIGNAVPVKFAKVLGDCYFFSQLH